MFTNTQLWITLAVVLVLGGLVVGILFLTGVLPGGSSDPVEVTKDGKPQLAALPDGTKTRGDWKKNDEFDYWEATTPETFYVDGAVGTISGIFWVAQIPVKTGTYRVRMTFGNERHSDVSFWFVSSGDSLQNNITSTGPTSWPPSTDERTLVNAIGTTDGYLTIGLGQLWDPNGTIPQVLSDALGILTSEPANPGMAIKSVKLVPVEPVFSA